MGSGFYQHHVNLPGIAVRNQPVEVVAVACVPSAISVIGQVLPELKKRKKVAAYARVSMETEMLLHSLSAQVSHYNFTFSEMLRDSSCAKDASRVRSSSPSSEREWIFSLSK